MFREYQYFVLILVVLNSMSQSVFVRPKKPDYNELETWPGSDLSTDPEFVEVCRQMAGYVCSIPSRQRFILTQC